jgi:hypothetical protein
LQASLNELAIFHAMFPEGFQTAKYAVHQSSAIAPSQLFDSRRSAPSSLKGLPTAAFLVPAVIEAIQASEFASITAVVPGEADPFCAGAACKSGAIILTSDSDLLVYDLGARGAVAFFNQLEPCRDDESYNKCEVVRASVSQPLEIAQRLGLDDLKQFSFELLRDPSIPLTELVKRAKRPLPEPLPHDGLRQKTFRDFCKDYDLKTFDFKLQTMDDVHITGRTKHTEFLDPRLSELILTSSSSPFIYLPILIEDPSKSAAWNVSRDLRHFAYSCLKSRITACSIDKVMEYCRRGDRIVSEVVPTISQKMVRSRTRKLAGGLETFFSVFSDFSNPVVWRTFALSEILHSCTENQKKLPSRSALVHFITGRAKTTISWLDIHLSAQVDGVLYSLRMLSQILNYSRGLPNSRTQQPQTRDSSLIDEFSNLSAILNTLPPLNQLLPSRLELGKQWSLESLGIDHLLDLLASHLQLPPSFTRADFEGEYTQNSNPSTDGFQTVPKKHRRHKDKDKDKDPKTVSTQPKHYQKARNDNIFDALLNRETL